MQTLHRMDVDARLTTQNAGIARSKLIGRRVVDEDRLWITLLAKKVENFVEKMHKVLCIGEIAKL